MEMSKEEMLQEKLMLEYADEHEPKPRIKHEVECPNCREMINDLHWTVVRKHEGTIGLTSEGKVETDEDYDIYDSVPSKEEYKCFECGWVIASDFHSAEEFLKNF